MATNAKLENISACVFDAYGTLFDFNAAAERCRDSLGDVAESLSRVWRQKQLEYTWQRSLRGDYVDFWHLTGHSLDYAMKSLRIEDPLLRSRLMELYFALDAYPEVRELLETLKAAGMRTAILSNGSPSMLVSAVRNAELEDTLDKLLSVDPLQIYKPHPKVYQLAVDEMRAPAENIAFMSANAWDVSGAAHFGLRVVWINRAGAQREETPGEPEAEIRSLAELPAMLGL